MTRRVVVDQGRLLQYGIALPQVLEAIDEAIQQIARAAGILKGSAVADAVLRLLKTP